MKQILLGGDVPLDLGVALATNELAMERFSALSQPERAAFLSGAKAMRSKEELRRYVGTLTSQSTV